MELSVSMAVLSILLAGAALSLAIVGRTMEQGGPAGADSSAAAELVEQVAADLRVALSFTEPPTAIAVEITVPDRDEPPDGEPETIRYEWLGAPGTPGPLTRSYNDGPASVLAADVRHFDLGYLTQTLGPPPLQESAELELFRDNAVGGSPNDKVIEPNRYPAQTFTPALPVNAVSWRITRVLLRLKADDVIDGRLEVQVRRATVGHSATHLVLQGVQLDESALGLGYAWVQFDFGSVSGLRPQGPYCVVVQHVAGAKAAKLLRYDGPAGIPPGAYYLETNDGGASWGAPVNNKIMAIYVYGTVTTQGPPQW